MSEEPPEELPEPDAVFAGNPDEVDEVGDLPIHQPVEEADDEPDA